MISQNVCVIIAAIFPTTVTYFVKSIIAVYHSPQFTDNYCTENTIILDMLNTVCVVMLFYMSIVIIATVVDTSSIGCIQRSVQNKQYQLDCSMAEMTYLENFLNTYQEPDASLSAYVLKLNGQTGLGLSLNNLNFISKRFSHVKELLLSRCNLTNNHVRFAFLHANSLQRLDLSGNLLTKLTAEICKYLPNLTELLLANNHISHLDKEAFSGPGSSLKVLDLTGNRLTSLSGEVFSYLTDIKFLGLNHNQWHCDCKMGKTIQKILPILLNLNGADSVPVCLTPQLMAGIPWAYVDDQDVVCQPNSVHNDSGLVHIEIPKPSIPTQIWITLLVSATGSVGVISLLIYILHRNASDRRTNSHHLNDLPSYIKGFVV